MPVDPLLRLLTTPDATGAVALSSTAADEVLERTVLMGGTVDTAVQELGALDEQRTLQALQQAWRHPVADRSAQNVLVDEHLVLQLRATLPKKLADTHGLCPLQLQGRTLTVLARAPDDGPAFFAQLEELGFALSLFVQPLLTTEALYARAAERIYGTPVPPRLAFVLAPMAYDVDLDADNIELLDTSGWSTLSPAHVAVAEPAAYVPPLDDESGWQIPGKGTAVLPRTSAGVTAPRLELIVDGTVAPGGLPPALQQQKLLYELEKKEAERRRRRREKVLWSVDDAISELALCDHRDDLLEVMLRFAWRRLHTASIFVRIGAHLSCFDVLDPNLEQVDLRGAPLLADGEHAIGRAMSLMSPSLGPVDDHDPLCRLLGRRPRAVVVVPIVLGGRAIGAVVGDNADKVIASVVLAELQMVAPRLSKALGNLVLRAKAAATARTSTPPPLPVSLPPLPVADAVRAPAVEAPVVAAAPAIVEAPLAEVPAVVEAPAIVAEAPAVVEAQAPAIAAPAAPIAAPATVEPAPSGLAPPLPTPGSQAGFPPLPPPVTVADAVEPPVDPAPRPRMPTVTPLPLRLSSLPPADGPALPPSPGARAKEALLQATARAWLAAPADADVDALVATLQQDLDAARAAIPRLVAMGARALPALARAFPGVAVVVDEAAADASARLLASPMFEVLRRLGDDRCAPIVVFALDHKDRHVRFGAVVASKMLDVPAALPGLGRRLFDPEPRIAAFATDVLAHAQHVPGHDAVLARLRDLCRRGDDTERRLAVRAVAGLRDVGAIAALIDLLPVRPRDLADEARLALVEITRQDFGVAERRWRAWFADHGHKPRKRWLIDALAHRELPLRRAAADDLADEGAALFGYRADGPPGERAGALMRVCEALGEPLPV